MRASSFRPVRSMLVRCLPHHGAQFVAAEAQLLAGPAAGHGPWWVGWVKEVPAAPVCGTAVPISRSCRSDSPLPSQAVLRSELHIPSEIRAAPKIEFIDTHQRRAPDERNQRTVGGELLGLLLSPVHRFGETGIGFVDRQALHPIRTGIAAIVNCPVRRQFFGSRCLKQAAQQSIWLFQ